MGKKQICRNYSQGICRFGDKCRFRHVAPEGNSSASAQACTTNQADAQLLQMTAQIVELIDESRHHALLAEVAKLKDEVYTLSEQNRDLEDQRQGLEEKNLGVTVTIDELNTKLQETLRAFDAMKHENDELKKKMQLAEANNITRRNSSSSGSNGRAYLMSSRGAEWQFQVAAKEWAGLPADSSEELRKYFEEYVKTKSGNATVSMKSGVDEYEFNFQTMTQLNVRTGKSRHIRCNFDTPRHWTRCVSMENIYPTDSSPIIEISGFTIKDLNGVYRKSKFDTFHGRPAWWKEDGSVMGYVRKSEVGFILMNVSNQYPDVKDVKDHGEGWLSVEVPCAAGVWKQYVGGNWEPASVSVVPKPSASLGSCLSLMSLAVEIFDDGTLHSLQRVLGETATHASAFQGVSACNCFKQHVKIKRAMRIENWHLWTKYCNHVDQMSGDLATHGIDVDSVEDLLPEALVGLKTAHGLARASANECLLFHGTTYDVAVKIALEGFDFRLSNAGYYGHGTYFASQACKSHQYTETKWNLRTVIISRVAVGDIFYATKVDNECRRPPMRESSRRCYDSIVAKPGPMVGHKYGNQTHQEFVVFDKFQAYPELIIQYECD